jgi:hypothetical protein
VETVAIQGDFYAGRLYIYSNLMQITKGSNWLKILFLALDLLQGLEGHTGRLQIGYKKSVKCACLPT